jgi:hypothetical protein
MLQPKKKIVKTPVVTKPVRKKPITPVDDYKDMVDPATGKKGTMGGEGTTPPFTRKERSKMPRVGNMGSAKNGKSFPDLNKDGKITRADILKGRGVIAKKGATIKKAQMGGVVSNEFAAKSISKPKAKSRIVDSPIKTSKRKDIYAFQGKKGMLAKSGATVKKAQNGTAIKQQKWKKDYDSKIKGVKGMSENEKVKKGITKLVPLASQIKANVMPPKPPKKKMGGSMKKCKYGCK